ncbi:MAG TPA: DUF885 family protein [Candidatus Acidoferrales bacterium]|nr:DUF885 family protein [Candidatus Acidoferrales bacterium]
MSRGFWVILSCVLLLVAVAPMMAQQQHAEGYELLVRLNDEIRADAVPPVVDGVPDYRPAAIAVRQQKIGEFRRRLAAISPSSWTVSEKVDYLLVQARLNALEFLFRVQHPWSSDPGLYVDAVQRVAFAELPVQGDALTALQGRLAAVPTILTQAKANLTQGQGEFVKLAIRDLSQSDGVEERWPFRKVPPPGARGWYTDFIERAKAQQPELVAPAEKALAAVNDFDAWLKQHASEMKAPVGVGQPDFEWYMRYVRYMPYTMEDSVRIGNREYERGMAFLALERHKNRDLPEIALPVSKEEYDKRMLDAQDSIREFLIKDEILTIPDYASVRLAQEVPWTERVGGKRNFWEEIQFRDPRPDVAHATLPGHAFDAIVRRHDTRPIRGTFSDGGRAEGWAFYLEEGMLQVGYLDDRPRTKELIYIFQAARGVRDPAEAKMQTNEWTVDQAVAYMVGKVPYMDRDVARVDAAIYLRQPTYGLCYQLGKMEMLKLVGDREHQLGEKFNLKEFDDQFIASGTIPISLIRWEITGLDDEVKAFWNTPEIPSVAGKR